jgi:pimeloyl-ACP methyl ester carboxylesterase
MSEFVTDGATLVYEVHGSGYPVLALAPGFLNSRIERWRTNPARPGVPQNFMDPIEALRGDFQVIALDIRNAGESRGPIGPDASWDMYIADFCALLDHLGITRCHVMGACIGVNFSFALAQARPGLLSSMVLQNPIGLHENANLIDEEFEDWASRARGFAEVDSAALPGFHDRLFAGDFIFTVDRDFVKTCDMPILLMPGDDQMHPAPISAEIAELAPDVEVLAPWKGDGHKERAIARARDFFIDHTPR